MIGVGLLLPFCLVVKFSSCMPLAISQATHLLLLFVQLVLLARRLERLENLKEQLVARFKVCAQHKHCQPLIVGCLSELLPCKSPHL